MHKLTRHALLASVTVAALLTTGCSASSSTETDNAGAAAAETPAASSAPDQLAVVQAPLGKSAPTALATQDATETGDAAQKSSLKVASYDKKSGRAVIAAKSATVTPLRPPPPRVPPLALRVGDGRRSGRRR